MPGIGGVAPGESVGMVEQNNETVTGDSRDQRRFRWSRRPRAVDYAIAILAQAALTGLLFYLTPVLPLSDYPIPNLLVIMLIAYTLDLWPAVVASLFAWLAYTYLFVPPRHTLWPIAVGHHGWAKEVAFLVGAVVVNAATIQARRSKRRVEQTARELQAHAATLQEQAHMLDLAHILVRDLEGRIMFWNQGAEALYGWSKEEAVGAMTHELLQTVFPKPLEEIEVEVAEAGEWQGELTHTRRDGSRIVLASHWVVHWDSAGAANAIIEVNNDITELKRAQEESRANEARYRSLFANMSEAFIVCELLIDENGVPYDWRYLDVNPAFEDNTGIRAEDALGKTFSEVMKRNGRVWIDRFARVAETGEPLRLEEYDRQFGRWFAASAYKVADRQFAVLFSDVTERRRAEDEIRQLNAELEARVTTRTAQLQETLAREQVARAEADAAEARTRSWLELAPDGIVIVTADGNITFVNGQAGCMFGYEPEELIGRAIETLIPERYHGVHVGYRSDYVADPRTWSMGVGLDLYGRRRDGSEFPVEIALSPNQSDETLTITAIIRDITERKQAEEEIRRLNDGLRQRATELEVSNKELEAFSYSVSHDLRAPLRAIDGFSNALLRHYTASLDERGQDYLHRVRAAAQRMAQLIDDILGLSRASRVQMRMQEVDLSAMALEIIKELRRSQPHRQSDVYIQPEIIVSADVHLLRIVLDNLIGNAWKFTSGREVACIEIAAIEGDGERVYYVKDNGAGYNPAYADKLFSPFQRLHTEDEFAGTGIGLALVQRVIRRHGGRIWSESAVDQGATFYFTLGEQRHD